VRFVYKKTVSFYRYLVKISTKYSQNGLLIFSLYEFIDNIGKARDEKMCSQKDLKVQKQAKVDISRVVVMNG